MNRLKINSHLFEILASSPPAWWNDLVQDEDVAIQIRKDNYIDVYYNGGNIIRKLTFDGKSFKGETHFKYIPLEIEGSDYIPFIFGKDSITFGKVNIMKLERFSKKSLKRIKEAIVHYYPTNSEKAIQYRFIKNDPWFIDSEFEYSYKDGRQDKTIRIDLVRLDSILRKIVFVEVKTVGDRRLFNNDIVTQLRDYKNFIIQYKPELEAYYKKLIEVKRNLKILPDCVAKENINNYGILEKPLLLLGDCEQEWIDKNASKIDVKINDYAVGAYYFGKPAYHCDITKKSNRNRHIFVCP